MLTQTYPTIDPSQLGISPSQWAAIQQAMSDMAGTLNTYMARRAPQTHTVLVTHGQHFSPSRTGLLALVITLAVMVGYLNIKHRWRNRRAAASVE